MREVRYRTGQPQYLRTLQKFSVVRNHHRELLQTCGFFLHRILAAHFFKQLARFGVHEIVGLGLAHRRCGCIVWLGG